MCDLLHLIMWKLKVAVLPGISSFLREPALPWKWLDYNTQESSGEDTGVRGLTFFHSIIVALSAVLPEMRAREREGKIDSSLVSPCCG